MMNLCSCDILLIIPYELLMMILHFLDISSLFSLGSTSKKYKQHKIICSSLEEKIQKIRCTLYFQTTIEYIRFDTILGGHTNLLKWLVHEDENNCLINNSATYNYAALGGHLEMVQYLHDIKCQQTKWACYHAARNNHLEVLKYLHKNGFYCDKNTCYIASWYGHLEILKYLHENGCPWDIQSCIIASKHGHLEVVKYLHENGRPWHENDRKWYECLCQNAAANNHLETLKYLHENGYPWNVNSCIYADMNGHLEILQYLHENGCPR